MPTFSKSDRDFTLALNKRVSAYFKNNKINRFGNSEMVIKSFVMFGLYFIPYALIISGIVSSIPLLILAVIIMALGVSGIGLSVMHDANHGAYSKKKWLNNVIGYSLNLVGANAFNWRIQHNLLHHTYTNVLDEDEDISPRGAIRMSPEAPWKKIHRYQYIYAWFLYGLMTLSWVFFKDFDRIRTYYRNGLLKKQKGNFGKELAILISTKALFVGYIFIVPLLLTSLLWWQILLGIIIMHYIAGFMLAIIFQPAHVIEGTEYPAPDENNELKYNWTIHQLHTTTNFGNNSKWFSWFVGGLNFQIEHHLFPNVCHVHYRGISAIVRSTSKEFGLPYKSSRTFIGALFKHYRLLKVLGIKPAFC